MGQSGYLIDSNVVIGYLDAKLPSAGMTFVSEVVDEGLNLSVITKIEVLGFTTQNSGSGQLLKDFIDASNVYELSDAVVDQTIILRKTHKIKLPDAIIAATALVSDKALITRNISDFKNIPDLKLFNPWDI